MTENLFQSWHRTATILTAGAKGEFDERIEEPEILIESGVYHVWYAGWTDQQSKGSIGYARGSSLDKLTKQGIALDRGPEGAFDTGYVSGPRIFQENGAYHLFYFGYHSAGFEAGGACIGVATATRPEGPWVRHAVPLLTPGPENWDVQILYRPFVVKENGTYHLFYNARGGTGQEDIGYATASRILGPYIKSKSNPILYAGATADRWDHSRIGDIQILHERIGGQYIGFYFGQTDPAPGQTGFATAPDLKGPWTPSPQNPIGILDEKNQPLRPAIRPALFRDPAHGHKWRMLYDDAGASIGLADLP